MQPSANLLVPGRQTDRPTTYFQLIQRVGSSGKYQRNMFLIFVLVWFVTGIILMNTSFLFLNKNFQCKKLGFLTSNCKQDVCSLDKDIWQKFIVDQEDDFQSIASQSGPFFCQDQYIVDLAKCSAYLGSFLGFIIFSYISDNYGRRRSLLIALATEVIGTVTVAASQNLAMASIGLILGGGGANASIGMTFYFLTETVQDMKRQKYSVLIQISFTIGAILVVGFNYILPNWRVVSIILITIPSIVALFLVYIYVQQTPQFLLKKPSIVALKALNRIDILQQQDLLSVKQMQMATQQFNQLKITPLDLLRYPSLRSPTICCCIISFAVYALYYGPVLVVQQIGFNIYVSSVIIQLSQLVIFIPAYYYIEQMKRKFMGLLTFGITVLCSGILIFLEKPEDCDLCAESVVELVLVFIFRSAVSMYFCLFFIYVNQLYPSRVSGLGLGIISAFGVIASTISPILLGIFKRNNFNVMIVFCAIGILTMGITNLMGQTLGKPLKTQIQQIQMLKQKKKTQILGRLSLRRSLSLKNSLKKQNTPLLDQ